MRQKLTSQFVLTRLSDDRKTVTLEGTVVLLHKAGVGIVPVSVMPPERSTYKNGKISIGFMERDRVVHNATVASDNQQKALLLKEGARVGVTAIMVETEGVTLRLYTGGYCGDLYVPFPNGVMPPVDDVLKTSRRL